MRRDIIRLIACLSVVASVGGILVGTAVAAKRPSPTPGAPTGVTAVARYTSMTISWNPPTYIGSGPIIGYRVAGAWGTVATDCSTSNTSSAVSGLKPGKTYSVKVQAYNSVKAGPFTLPIGVKAGLPDPPTGVNGQSGNASARVNWIPPALNSGVVSGYRATANPGGRTCTTATASPPPRSCTVTGLINGTPYTFTVTSTDVYGISVPSAPSTAAIPLTTPDAPTGVTGTSYQDSQALVTWTAPNDGGSAPTYAVTASPGGGTCASPTTSCTVTGLVNGTPYTFTVIATNVVGPGPPSAPSAPATPSIAPDAPTGVTVTAGSGSDTVSWTAPENDGGNPVASYTVTASPGGNTCSSADPSTLSCAVTISNTRAHTFVVTAVNPSGSSPGASASLFTPGCVPAPRAALAGCAFSDIDLQGVDLDRSDLTGVDFTGANLSGANLDYATLNNVTLDNADLTGAFLFTDGSAYDGISAVGATLPTGFKVVGSYLVGPSVNISGVDFSGADFTGAILNQGSLTNDNLTGANLSNVDLDRTDLTGSNLANANLTGADLGYDTLNNVTLDNADLTGAFLFTNGSAYNGISAVGATLPAGFKVVDSYLVGPGVNISGADFSGADFTGAKLSTGSLTDDNFTNADLSNVDLDRTDLTGSNLTNANLTGTDLGYDTLNGVTLDNADLTGAFLYISGYAYNGISTVGATLPAGFKVVDSYLVGPGVNASGVDFSGGDFTGASLNTGTLTDDNFTNANFAGADLDQTDVNGSTFTGVNLSGVIFDATTCPDGTVSDMDGGTCINNL